MPRDRYMTVHFNDGSKLSFEFPEQSPNAAAKQMKVSEFLTSKHLVVEAEGSVLLIPVTSIKYISLNAMDVVAGKSVPLPKHAILGARIRS
jgi:hypothetical protein